MQNGMQFKMNQRGLRTRSLLMGVVMGLGTGTLAWAQDLPVRKPGLWEITMRSDKDAPQVVKHCVDEKTDAQMQQMGRGSLEGACSSDKWRKEGAALVNESVCKMGNSTITTRAVFTGDFKTTVRTEVDAKYAPPMMGMAGSKTVLDGKFLGACPAGWKPGDMEIPGAGRMNVQQMMQGMPGAGKAPRPGKGG